MGKTIQYTIDFYSGWAIGTGLGSGSAKDSIVLKDKNNHLPFIPGKTIKGLLRDAAQECGIPPDIDEKLFGQKKHGTDEKETVKMHSGILYFASARLPQESIDTLSQYPELISGLYKDRVATRLNKNKQAEDGSLRKKEYCIPMLLEGSIEILGELKEAEEQQLRNSFKMLRLLGENRYRGLGRCMVSLKEKS